MAGGVQTNFLPVELGTSPPGVPMIVTWEGRTMGLGNAAGP